MDKTVREAGNQPNPERDSTVEPTSDPFALTPALSSTEEVQAALELWAEACLDLSLPDLAVGMLEVATPNRTSGDQDAIDLRRAFYLLHADRFHDALAALPSWYRQLPDQPSEVRFGHLIQATAEAALGSDKTLSWLVSRSASLLHSDAAEFYTACLARVAEARKDQSLLDSAHRQLGHLGFLNRRTTPKTAALMMLGRDQSDLDAAHQTLTDTLEMLQRCSQSFARDPQPVLDTATELVRRDDRSGAALLLKWVNRLDPQGQRVKAAFLPLSPRKVGLRRGMVMTVLWLAAAVVAGYALWHTMPGLLLPLAGVALLWHRYVPLPGMSLVDSRLYRRIRPIQAEPLTSSEIRTYCIVGVVTLAFCAMWAAIALAAIGSRLGMAWNQLPLWIEVLVWTVAMGVVPALVGLAGWRIRRRRKAREADRRKIAEQRELVATSGRCRCWDTAVLLGPEVEGYLAGHLHPLPLPAVMAELNEAHRDLALRTAYCSQTGAAWLGMTISAEGACYLLRGPLGINSGQPHDDRAGVVETGTGFYL